MLILSRKKEEQIVIGNDVVITVLDVDGDKVKIGIDAPMNVKVLRRELVEDVKAVNTESMGVSVSLFSELKAQMEKK